MKFGPVPAAEAEGALLAHSLSVGGTRLAKGRRLSRADIDRIVSAGVSDLIVARPGPDDVPEDEVARRIGDACAGAGIRAAPAVHGRVNLHAEADGLLLFDPAAIDALNRIDEAITIGTLPRFAVIRRGEVAATIKIIPYAVDRATVARAEAAAAPLAVAAFRPTRLDLIHTRLPGQPDKAVAKASRVIRARTEAIGGDIVAETACPHDEAALAALLAAPTAASITLVSGASATLDRRDVIPAAIVAAGGTIERLGMPVDPGNLLCLGRIGARTVIGLPGCARSPKRNGIDLVLERLLAGLDVDSAAIAAMGVGGLLPDTGDRPQPRVPARPATGMVEAIVLAAGRASRMGSNKLAADLAGKPVVAHVVDAIAAAGLPPPVVVLGHDGAAVRAALAGGAVRFVEAEDHAAGLSQSLRAGIAAVAPQACAAIVCLGDMPFVPPALLARMAVAARDDAILVPRLDGRAGNPVLWGRAYFARLATLAGDVGAKSLLGEFADRVDYLDTDDPGVRIDVDTPEALAAARARTAG